MFKRLRDLFSIPAGIPPVLVWGLASFHAAALIFIVVFYLQLTDGLRGFFGDGQGAGTVIGLIAFGVLWLASFAGTARGLEKAGAGRFEMKPVMTLIATGSFGGFVTGVTFLLVGAVVVLGAGLRARGPAQPDLSAHGLPREGPGRRGRGLPKGRVPQERREHISALPQFAGVDRVVRPVNRMEPDRHERPHPRVVQCLRPGFADGLPVGLQLVTRPFNENRLLALGAAFQRQTDWHLRKPSVD